MRLGRLVLALAAILAIAAEAAAAVPLTAGGLRIDWPLRGAQATVEPGTPLVVTVRSRAGAPAGSVARVSLVRFLGHGAPPERIASATLRDGRFVVRAPASGGEQLALRVVVGSWRHRTRITTTEPCERSPRGRRYATLLLDRAIARTGELMRMRFVNTTETCVALGMAYGWERPTADGGWEEAPGTRRPFTLQLIRLDLYDEFVQDVEVLPALTPGTYRITKSFWRSHSYQRGRERMAFSRPFEVAGP